MREKAPWGKFADGESHHLAHHCADVAACFEAMAALPVVRSRMEQAAGGPLSGMQVARLAVLVFLHDCGKLHPGFQAKGWPEGGRRIDRHGHVAEGAAIFLGNTTEAIAANLHLQSLKEWNVHRHLLFAVLAHHGRPLPSPLERRAQHGWQAVDHPPYDPVAASQEMGAMIRHWFGDAFADGGDLLPDAPDFQHLLCGLVSLADWLGSTREVFPFVAALDRDYMAGARAKAAGAVAEVGIDVEGLRQPGAGKFDFATLAGGRAPRPPQRLVGEFPLDEQLVILEAETGSGKTEAALWRFVQLFEAGCVDSLYFALPTRAAALQIHRRVNDAMRCVFGADGPEAVLAVPGYIKAGEAKGRQLPDWSVKWDDDDGADEKHLLRRWAAESSKRALAAPIAVGTVDQVMLAALQVKHAHLRAAALSRSLIVIDEVHASDRYMTGVQTHLLKMHRARGGFAMLMSATLGSVARAKWMGQRSPPSFCEAVAAPYPAVWGSEPNTPLSARGETRARNVAMRTVPTMAPDAVAALAIEAARKGARVLVIRNTVKAAVAAFDAVRQAGGEGLLLDVAGGPALHHSRFAPDDRRLLDKAVETALAADAGAEGGRIVIGTQTLEQSLDIDADLLLTDLCPVDVLLQRIGRLHRHDRSRPDGFGRPHCHVLMPEQGLEILLEPRFCNGLGAWETAHGLEGIYRDVACLELTRRLVADHGDWEIPSMNRRLVEGATHCDRIEELHDELGKPWQDYSARIDGKKFADAGAASLLAVPIETEFAEVQFPDSEERIRTRLGAEGARITLTHPIVSPFGEKIEHLTLPDHLSRGIDPTDPVAPEVGSDGFRFQAGDRSFRYDRRGLSQVKE